MEAEPNKNKKNNYWTVLTIFLLFVAAALILSQQGNKSKKTSKKFSNLNQRERYDKRQNNSIDDEDSNDNEDQDYRTTSALNQAFRQKGYLSDRDIKELRHWGLEANDVPDLKAGKRRGVVNTLAVDETGKGSCSELVIIKKKSPHVNNDNLSSMKIIQSEAFADTRNINDAVIRFAINKIIKKGHNWEYDVYVLKVNSDATTISGPSASSGVYMALLSSFYSDCALFRKIWPLLGL